MMLTDRQEAKKKGPLQGAPFLFQFLFYGLMLDLPLKYFTFLSLCFFNHISFAQSLKIIHTNDLHSFFKGTLVKENQKVLKQGGYSRIATLIRTLKVDAKEKDQFHITVDAGDFYSGTIFHTLAMQASLPLFPEYEFFTNLEYDGVTLGNHEFDGKDEGFDLLMKKVKQLGNKVPIVSTNFINRKGRPYPVVTSKLKVLKSKNSMLRVGLLGALGPDGCSVSQANRHNNKFIGHDDEKRKSRWGDLIDKLKDEVSQLKKDGAELIILLLHGGGEEDEKLAKEIPNLDVIIAGHTHQNYFKRVRDVWIAQAGSYGRFVGEVNLVRKGRRWELLDEKRHLITQELEKNTEVEMRIDTYFKHIKKFFTIWGIHNFEENVSKNKLISFEKDLYRDEYKGLGLFVMDSIRNGINLEEETPLHFYMGVRGLVRKPIFSNHSYDFSELFNILPLGFHDGSKPGYRSVSFYLNRND